MNNCEMKQRVLHKVVFLGILAASCAREPVSKTEKLKLPPGFQAEHLYSPSDQGTGSWVSMTFDNKGRIIASDQYGGLYRMEVPPVGQTGRKPRVERLGLVPSRPDAKPVEIGFAQGLLWAFNSLYVVVNSEADTVFGHGSGFYRLQDTDNDDRFDQVTLIRSFDGFEEHGPHSVILSPDKKHFYLIAGNFTRLPEMDGYLLPPVWQRDNLLPDPTDGDARAHPHGGWIARVDTSGTRWELFSAGLRNPFDLAFNQAGDLFTYDSDMEWDIGMSWYRPTRLCHVTSGSEFGWRDGNGKWRADYPDNLPALINIGQGSPTNLISAHEADFPEPYRNALLAFDWSFGIIYAIHLEANGASYNARAEEFISGAPLPLTDGVIGPDGALYFLTGGRRLESDLYRVVYTGPRSAEQAPVIPPNGPIRKKLEAFHGKQDTTAIGIAWPYLNHKDRYVRYAARIALEHQPVDAWQKRVFSEKDPRTVVQASLALARVGSPELRDRLLSGLMKIELNALPEETQFELLRAVELVLSRMGLPDPTRKLQLIQFLDAGFPAESSRLNQSMSKILVFLDAASATPKIMTLLEAAGDDAAPDGSFSSSPDLIFRNPQYGMDLASILTNKPPSQQIYYAMVLSKARSGWTPLLRENYFNWFYGAYAYKGGRHYMGYIDKARESALDYVPKSEYAYYDSLSTNTASAEAVIDWVKIMSDGGPGRNWKLQEALEVVENNLKGRDFEQGKLMYSASACISCHRMQGEGGDIGPDLTRLGSRFTVKDILASIIEPNQVISDQYAATIFYLHNGSTVIGKLVKEDETTFYLSQNPFDPQVLRELDKQAVAERKLSDVSVMPPGLVNSLSEDRLRDLIAYLVAGGNKDHPVFSKN